MICLCRFYSFADTSIPGIVHHPFQRHPPQISFDVSNTLFLLHES